MPSDTAQSILPFLPGLSDTQIKQLEKLGELYRDWNAKVNLISRKDIDFLFQHHILHALTIARFVQFKPNTSILDLGTGGGFPGLPLAIYFPEVQFHLVDARSKKIMVVNDIIDHLNLKNVKATHGRVEELKGQYDFIVSRAVASIQKLMSWTNGRIAKKQINALPNGYILLKGGEIKLELKEAGIQREADIVPLDEFVDDPWYKEKKIVYFQG